MSAISSWVLSIVGVSILSVLLDLFLPDGETNGHIRSVFNFVVILVIILPLPQLLNKEINVEDYFHQEEIVLQEDFLYQLNKNKLTELEENIESALEKNGYSQVEIAISADIFAEKMQIEAVFVDLTNLVILQEDKHIDIKKEVIACVQTYITIEKEKIIFSG